MYAGAVKLLLFLILLLATSFEYLWRGPLPFWMYATLLAAAVLLMRGSYVHQTWKITRKLFFPVILPWLLYISIAVTLDAVKGFAEVSIKRVFLLNVCTLMALLVVAVSCSLVRVRFVVRALAFIAFAQALVAIAQYSGSELAWTLPDTIFNALGDRVGESSYEELKYDGRVRGTNLLIHKFNVMQGMLVSFLLVIAMLGGRRKSELSGQWLLRVSTPVSLIAVVLTFSRSTVAGMALALSGVLANTRSFKPLLLLMAGALVIYMAVDNLGIRQAKQFNRLSDFSRTSDTNAARLRHLEYAGRVFVEYPLMGREQKNQHIGPVHSVVLRVVVDYGVLGLVPYLWVVGGIASVLWRRGSLGEPYNVIAWAGLCSFGAGVFDAWTHSSGLLVRDVTQPVLIGAYLGMVLSEQAQGRTTAK